MTTILQAPGYGASYFSSSPIHTSSYQDLGPYDSQRPHPRRSGSKPSYNSAGYESNYPPSTSSSTPSSPQLSHSMYSQRPSYVSTPSSCISLDTNTTADDDDIMFPSFENSGSQSKPSQLPLSTPTDETDPPRPVRTPTDPGFDLPESVHDDQAVQTEPTRHVDYLSHEWKEEDIWSSWSYVVHRRKTIANGVRLENASWRTWTKAKNNLKTVSPETLNWLKDCDVTWLYGPLQTGARRSLTTISSPPPSRLSQSPSFAKKPILKKRSASAAILERSQSQHSLLQRAGDIIRVQQSSPAHGRPVFRRGASDFNLASFTGSSVANTPAETDMSGFSGTRVSFTNSELPTPADCKHVLFNEEVRQVQAVDSEDDEKEEERSVVLIDDDEDDDGGLMMAPSLKCRKSSSRSTPRGSFGNEGKTIVPLPSTTLKYRTDTPEPAEPSTPQTSVWPLARKLSPSPSQETLRPARPNHNFLIDDDPEIDDEPWQSSSYTYRASPYESEEESTPRMRRTPSGMFMPYDENEEEAHMNSTLFGQAMYAVNTVKDIAHVVWNVGWNRR